MPKHAIGLAAALLAVCSWAPALTAHAAGPLSGPVSAAIHQVMSHVRPNGPGLALAVVQRGRVAFKGSRGLADVARRAPITSRTVFDLASCSKQFTAMATMVAAQRGMLRLDDAIRRFVPEIPVYDASRPITVTHLLHMTSGLPIYTDFLDDLDGVHNVDVARRVGKRKLMFPTGSRHQYNNTDYALLALIVERAAKKPFAAFMQEAVFRPAGMSQTMVLDDPHKAVPNRCQGYTPGRGQRFEACREDTYVVGDGQVFTTLDDMIKWEQALRGNTLVKRDMQRKAFVSGRLSNGEETGYGFGWFVSEDDDVHFLSHEGNWTGTNTYISRDLVEDVSLILLSNNDAMDVGNLSTMIEDAFD